MSLNELLVKNRDAIQRIATKHGVVLVRVWFGSLPRRHNARQRRRFSGLKQGPIRYAWFPAGLVLDLESLLGKRVEVVTELAAL